MIPDKYKPARRKASLAYNKRQDTIVLRPAKEKGAEIRAAAAAAGESMQGWIMRAVQDRLDKQEAGE